MWLAIESSSVRRDDDLMDDDLTFRTIDPCHPGTCPGIPLRWSKIFWFHGRAIDLWQLLICRCRKVRSREECASWVETDVARHLRLPAWWCAPILQLTDFACKRTARVHVDSKIKEVAGVLDLTLIPNKSQELMFMRKRCNWCKSLVSY